MKPTEEEIKNAAMRYALDKWDPNTPCSRVEDFTAGALAFSGLNWKRPEEGFKFKEGMLIAYRAWDKMIYKAVIGEFDSSGTTGGCGCCSESISEEEVLAYKMLVDLDSVDLPEWAK